MGLFNNIWNWSYEGHVLEVQQLTGHEYVLVIDGAVVDRYEAETNMGKRYLEATFRHDGSEHRVEAVAEQKAFTETVSVTVDGIALLLKQE